MDTRENNEKVEIFEMTADKVNPATSLDVSLLLYRPHSLPSLSNPFVTTVLSSFTCCPELLFSYFLYFYIYIYYIFLSSYKLFVVV